MFGEVVTSHEALLTLGTLEALVPWEEETPVTHRAHSQMLSQPPRRRSTRDMKLVMSKITVIGHQRVKIVKQFQEIIVGKVVWESN